MCYYLKGLQLVQKILLVVIFTLQHLKFYKMNYPVTPHGCLQSTVDNHECTLHW